jgi:FAD/FMN-containing dehydrogenase
VLGYWSSTLYASPSCIFAPQNALEVSVFVLATQLFNQEFAIRGGGHMPIPLYNNAEVGGILLATTKLNTLSLASDKKTLSVGPGRRWNEVADYLTPYGLAAVGGRVGNVGVPGFLLGGGISFYSSQYGFGSDNIVKYQVVTAKGAIIEPTANNLYSDLFWALKGGGNSFGLVTRFDIKVYSSPSVWVGTAQYDTSQRDAFLSAIYNFVKYGSADPKAAIIPITLTIPAAGLTAYGATRFYDAATVNPTVFSNFSVPKMTPVVDGFAYQPLSEYLRSTDPLQPNGLRQEFRTLSFSVDERAIAYVHDQFLGQINELAAVAGLTASFTFQPIPKSFIQAGINAGGNPQGVPINKAPYIWIVLNWSWTNTADDAAVRSFATRITAQVEQQFSALGVASPYHYLNDAGPGQPVFQGYPAANLAKLKTIRNKYDPSKVFTELMPGGWKVANA